jgi:hypothetical protein
MKPIVITGVLLVVIAGAVVAASLTPGDSRTGSKPANGSVQDSHQDSRTARHRFPVVINEPPGTPAVIVGQDSATGQSIRVQCATCHATKQPNPDTDAENPPSQFHQGLKFQHGKLTCLACHDSSNYEQLHLANGKPVAYTDVMTLCAQCHAKRHNDYLHGAHGGMNGHWDLSRGGRTRKHCVDCHNPHWPQFPRMRPTFKPIDRFLEPDHEDQLIENKTGKSHG